MIRYRKARVYTWGAALCLLLLPAASGLADGPGPLASLWQSLGLSKQQDAFLEPDKAFVFDAEPRGAGAVVVRWRIAEGYYLYRDRFSFRLEGGPAVVLGEPRFPTGSKVKEDEFFGRMEVYYRNVEVVLPVERGPGSAARVQIEASYQGCAEAGFCYPPMSKAVELVLPPV